MVDHSIFISKPSLCRQRRMLRTVQKTYASGAFSRPSARLVFDLKLEPGDVVLMCSDGLSNMVEDSQLREIISDTSTDLDEKGRILIREANRNGGKDNIAIVLVEPFADEVKAC